MARKSSRRLSKQERADRRRQDPERLQHAAYLSEVRPAFGSQEHPAVFVTERGTRISVAYVNERFAEIRNEAGLDPMLTPRCLRHSYVTHLAELGWAAKFIQDQVGHSHAATTAVYMSVGDDFKDRLLSAAIDEQILMIGGR
jgi:integrase/recombinase XerC